ncbi:MAG: hypothetical protein H7343_13605 [Undibacterium sp.]|nr:hypothetical protein [Opitutaceae bacterium]
MKSSRYHPGPHRGQASSRRGSALLIALIVAVVMGTTMAAVFSYTTRTARLEQRSSTRLNATYAGEYALEQALLALNTLVSRDSANLPTLSQTTTVTNLATAPTTVFTAAQGYTWQAYLTVPMEDGAAVAAHSTFNSTQGAYKFLSLAEFTRALPGQAPVRVQFQREWSYVITPLFQYAIFYNSDMELFPGANFIVNGRVHSNGTIYTGTTASITFSDYVSDVNGLSNQYSPLDPRGPGSPGNTITYNKGTPVVTSREEPPGTLEADTTDTNINNDGPREMIEIPDFVRSDPNATDRFYTKAGLKVLANTTAAAATADSGWTVLANTRLYATRDGTVIPATDPLATYLGTMLSVGGMNDYREAATLATTDIDVAKITAGYNAGGLPQNIPATATWPNNASVPAALRNQPIPVILRGKDFWNGVLYVADITDTTSHRAGVRLLNGTSLPDGTQASSPAAGLTVATANPAYIVGDFNTGGVPPSDSGSNLAANNYVAGYTVQPSSVIADAVTSVSANWISGNYDTVASLSSRTPVNTTVNTALISGIVASDGTAYSGGVENYIRLLENWSGRRLTYYGSIINLYQSRRATARWQTTGAYYNAPTRNWYFDTNFLDPRKLPPGTPVTRTLKRGQWAQLQ